MTRRQLPGPGPSSPPLLPPLSHRKQQDALNDKVDELVLHHVLDVLVGDEEGDVVALDGDAAEDDEGLGAHHEEPSELVGEDALNLVCLLDLDREPDRVDGRFDEDLLGRVARDEQRRQQHLGRGPAREGHGQRRW